MGNKIVVNDTKNNNHNFHKIHCNLMINEQSYGE